MELSRLFIDNPLIYLFLGIALVAAVVSFFLGKFSWISFLVAAVSFTAGVIYAFLNGASYLDVALIAAIILIPLLIHFLLRPKAKEVTNP